MLMIRWQPVAVRGDQVIHQRPDLIQVEFGSGMRVEHRCVVDMLAFAGQRASTVSAWTLMLVCISAARWGGNAPIFVG